MKYSYLSVLLHIMFLCPVIFGQARQDRFIIGTWYDPDFTGNPITDEARLQTLRNAHFNTVTGLNGVGGSLYEVSDTPAIYPSVHYKLDRVSKIPGLRMMVLDARYFAKPAINVESTVKSVIRDIKKLSHPKAAMGYLVWDEPSVRELANAILWIKEFNKQDNSRIAWANFPSFCGGCYHDWKEYAAYVESYLTPRQTSVASIDYYPFRAEGTWNDYGRGISYYFRILELFSSKTKANGAVFWAFPYSTRENKDWAPITRENLRFEAFAPIVYGARGLIYYTYAHLIGPPPSLSSIVDSNSDTTETYSWVRSINQQVETIGPLLMSLDWQATYHENAVDDGKYDGCSKETGLPTVPSNHFLIHSFASNSGSFMLGSFKSGNKRYLLVFNKDRTSARNVTITLKKPVPVWECDKVSGKWLKLASSANVISLSDIAAADMRVLRLAN